MRAATHGRGRSRPRSPGSAATVGERSAREKRRAHRAGTSRRVDCTDRPPGWRGTMDGGVMQVRHATQLSATEYVERQAWLEVEPPECPFHPGGDCQLVGHGTYERQSPPGLRVKRFRCRQSGATVSALPDCSASHTPGTLDDIERAARAVEEGVSGTDCGRSAGSLPQRVGAILSTVRGLDPDRYLGSEPTLAAFSAALGCTMVLVGLRAAAAAHLRGLPTPVGFHHCALNSAGSKSRNRRQQSTGRDPPPGSA